MFSLLAIGGESKLKYLILDWRLSCARKPQLKVQYLFFFFWVVRFLWSVLVNVSLSFISSACSAHILAICCGMYVTSEIVWNLH